MLKASCSAVLVMALGACSSNNAQVNMAQYEAKTEMTTPRVKGAESFELLADRMAQAGDHAAAVPLYRHLIKTNSFNSVLHTKLGLSLLALGNTHEAGQSLSFAVKKGQTGEANYGLGKVYLALGQYADAADQFYAATKNMSQDPRAYSGRGIALAALGNFDGAIASFDDGLRANPEDTDTLSNKALTLSLLGSAEVATAMLEDIAQSGQAGPRDRQNLALAYLAAGRRTDAVAMARLDLDSQGVTDTFSFYDAMMALPPDARMATLVTGMIPQSQSDDVAANLELVDTDARRDAAARMTTPPPPPPEPEPEPEPEPIPVLTPQDLTGWSLQIGAYRNIPNMIRGWKILYDQNEDILEGIEPRRSEVSFGERESEGPAGHYFRLNAGPLKSFERASEVCKELKVRGTDCWVRPPEVEEGRLPD